MPRPKELEPLVKVKVNLFAKDYERLKDFYPIQGPARVIRALVRSYVERIERQTSIPVVDVDKDVIVEVE